MLTSKAIFIIIVSICAIIFVVAIFSIFKKKGKKKGKSTKTKPEKDPTEFEVKPEKLSHKEPKINKKKLSQIAAAESKVTPAFSKEELEEERQRELNEQLKKNRVAAQPKQNIPFPNFSTAFPFQTAAQNIPFQQTRVVPASTPTPTIQRVQPVAPAQKVKQTFPEVKQEDKDFINALKQKGVIDSNKSFAESLVIKEAIDTPASKKDMKKKRQKWM